MITKKCFCGKNDVEILDEYAISHSSEVIFFCRECEMWCTICSSKDRKICGCWIQVEDIPFADLKALFAASDLSVEKELG